MRPVSSLLSIAIATLAGARAVIGAESADEVFFGEKVRPLLEERCFKCHSHKAAKLKGGLTLDSRSGWEVGGDTGPAVVPGKVDESLLIQMVRWSDEDHQMPPKEKLPAAEIALLEEWVKRGAPDPRKAAKSEGDWWSLKALVKPALPASADGNPIDAFIQAKLKEKQLSPSTAADRRTLIRRVFYDLHGLPPSPEEVDAFVKNEDPQAYEKLVDQLLASPRYGERWARHWLDTIHFADTHGFEHDDLRPNAWRFRDYVIASLNRDTPWDRFIREQIAADVLFPEEPQLTAALGFLGAGTYDSSAAGTAPMSFEYLDRDDLVTQTMAAFVSTTANCARCHAHKFDPISQEDYFALQAVFAGIGKGDIFYDDDPATLRERKRLDGVNAAVANRDAAVLLSAESRALVEKWEKERGAASAWEPVRPEIFVSAAGTTLERLDDGSILASGARPDTDTYAITATTTLREITALRLDLMLDDSLPVKGPGRAGNGNLHLSEFEVQIFRPGSAKAEPVKIQRATADFDQLGYGIAGAIDGNLKTSWAIHPNVGQPHYAVFELAAPVQLGPESKIVITLKQLQHGVHLLGRFKISALFSPHASPNAVPAAVGAMLETPAATRTLEQKLTLAAFVVGADAEQKMSTLPAPVAVWAAGRTATNERGAITIAEPRTIRLLKRGDLTKPGDEVSPGALSAVTALRARFDLRNSKDESARRAALADWLADPRQPLTWRSVVNRVWHYHFGKGICDTPSDFGRMGGEPSHPELIDWLAVWFRDDAKGSLKALHRLIVTSATYRQSSAPNSAASAIDPDNRLLWRMNRPRLDADSVRDTILAVDGRLDLSMGGPSVALFTSKPGAQSTPILDYDNFDHDSPGAARRSIYRLVWRAIADPFMDALDFPDMGLLAPVRSFSASPLQSLALFNNEFTLRHSERFAERLEKSGATTCERIHAAFRLALQREATAGEVADFENLSKTHGLAAACRVIFNSNEFLFLD